MSNTDIDRAYNLNDPRAVRMNIEGMISNLRFFGAPALEIRELAAIAERGSEHARAELQRHRQYLIDFADELEADLKQLRELLAKLAA